MSLDSESVIEDENSVLNAEGINVWSATQESLEKQALNELNEFAKETSTGGKDTDTKDDGESKGDLKSKEIDILENYIRKQEELKKLQIQKRYNGTPEHSEGRNVTESKRKNQNLEIGKRKRFKRCKVAEGTQDLTHISEDDSGSDYVPSEEDSDYDSSSNNKAHLSVKSSKIRKNRDCEKIKDDGLIENYNHRLDQYYNKIAKENESDAVSNEDNIVCDKRLEGGLKVPNKYWTKLYKYQQKGVKWLWSLHQKPSGGLLGDEMGLGKTVQIISFLYALDYSRIHTPFGNFVGKGPTIVVCPATVIHQWVQHFHEWAPEFRVAVLHQSGSFQGKKSSLIRDINENNGVLITTYLGILKYKGNFMDYQWHYLILDEGHKIRNASAKITVAVKQIRTPHRILLSGSPMQNNLQELWSLFDFTNPGILGALNTFMEHFNSPIIQGGFANATPMQEATALSVATALKNLISPFLLRRTKDEVQDNINLPSKSEQVLFCSLSDYQRMLYKDFLMSEHVNDLLGRGSRKWSSDKYMRAYMLKAITSLRKICNHPDIFIYDDDVPDETNDTEDVMFGHYKKSGKMIVVSALLKIWKKQKHRVLLFSQGRAMMNIFEKFLQDHDYKFLKMDGTTSIKSRQTLIDKFNKDETYDVFLLTTKVGGLGVNLTGADRVIIYDPDWNPATDIQARERAWRIGQNKQVTIYRLISVGTIEEKMYQRQIWKQLLSNKILIDPKTHRAFKSSDLFDLFSLQEPTDKSNPETTNIFRDSRVKIQEKLLEKKNKAKPNNKSEIVFSEEKIEKMKQLAQKLAKNLTQESPECSEKTSYQKQLEEERLERLKKKEELKKLSVQELLVLNRERNKEKNEDMINKVDDREASCSFSRALDIAETKAELYKKIMEGKLDARVLEEKLKEEKKAEKSRNKDNEKYKVKRKKKDVMDESGKIDGEKVEGLVKAEKRKYDKDNCDKKPEKDDFILSKLFASKGVSGALEHDSIIKGSVRQNNLRISTAASEKAQKAMQAITKSRLEKWRW